MKKLTLTELWLVLDNIVRLRATAVLLLVMGDGLMTQMRDLHNRLGAIPGVRDGRRPFVKDLAEMDTEHDMYGRALDLLLQMYEVLAPKLSSELNGVIALARRDILEGPRVLSQGYIDEAVAAKRRRPKLEEMGEALRSLPVAEVGSAMELAEAFTTKGEGIDGLLNQRGDADAVTRREAGPLRVSVLALLSDIRETIRLQRRGEERSNVRTLPENIEAQIFGYADALIQLRSRGNTSATPNDTIDLEPPEPKPEAPVEA